MRQEQGTLVLLPAICNYCPAQNPGTPGGSGSARPEGAGTPCPQPVIPAAPSEMLKRHNANSLALWPPRRCHGAVAENKHNSPHVFSAPSTPRPQRQPSPRRVCPGSVSATSRPFQGSRDGAELLPDSPGEGRHGPGSGTDKGHPRLAGDGEEMEIWTGMSHGMGEDAPGIAATAQPGRCTEPFLRGDHKGTRKEPAAIP